MMYAVHAFWSDRRGLCLWAEDTSRPVKSPSQATRRARPHPFAASHEDLATLHPRHPGEPASAILLLPSLLTAPLDSTELVRLTPRPAPRRAPALAPWSVPVVCLDAAAALAVLQSPGHEARHSASVQFWGEVAGLARDLAERGRVLPAVVPAVEAGPESWHEARWRPVIQGPDVTAVQTLVAAMPPVCRAETATVNEHTGQRPADLVDLALDAMVDAAVRDRLSAAGVTPKDALPRRRGRPPRRPPVVESWVQALTGPEGRFEADPDEVIRLCEALALWDGVGRERSGPARLVLRLRDPASGDAESGDAPDEGSDEDRDEGPGHPSWMLEFLLQSVADPSLLVPAEQVWDSGTGLRRWLDRPDELLLGELGRASTVYPQLGDALRHKRPSGMRLDPDTAYDFLSHRAVLLDQAGFTVQLPAWWSRRRTLGLRGSAISIQEGGVVAEGLFGRNSLCDFSWQLVIGQEPLTEEEMAALAAAKAPLIRLRGEWVAIDPEQIRRGLEFLHEQEQDAGQLTAADVIALAAQHPDDLDTPLPVVSVHGTGRLGELLSGTVERSLTPVQPPEDLHAQLRPYQERGLAWLVFLADLGLGACLADDMGLGKTVQLLALEVLHRSRQPEVGPTLLICRCR